MQISRHWRMNALRYRLEGVRTQHGETRLQSRPAAATREQAAAPAPRARATAAR
ncbi:MAG: hypothetical protein JNL34_12325 [Anaerolineae bacterium]|nr:hypothetical protein [Anaerolineae bacterium]